MYRLVLENQGGKKQITISFMLMHKAFFWSRSCLPLQTLQALGIPQNLKGNQLNLANSER